MKQESDAPKKQVSDAHIRSDLNKTAVKLMNTTPWNFALASHDEVVMTLFYLNALLLGTTIFDKG